jgi:DNA-binding transcriptional MerR regulator
MKKDIKALAGPAGGGSKDGSTQQKPMGSNELAKLARVSLRQLQWWDEKGLISPRHVGHTREYSPYEVQRVIALGKLRYDGRQSVSLQRCRKLIRYHASEIDSIVEAISLLRRVGLSVR